jgi:hypothetical protein
MKIIKRNFFLSEKLISRVSFFQLKPMWDISLRVSVLPTALNTV